MSRPPAERLCAYYLGLSRQQEDKETEGGHLLDRRRVPNEAHGHLQTLRRDVADAALHVVRNPLDEVRGILVLDVEHLLVNLLRRHPAAEETRRRQVAAMTSAWL